MYICPDTFFFSRQFFFFFFGGDSHVQRIAHTHTPILARKRMPGVGGGGGRCPSLIPVISEALYLVVGLGGWMDGWMDDTTLCTNTNKKDI